MYWMSFSSSMSTFPSSLHLVEHLAERILERERLLDLVGAHIGVLAVLEEARALMLPHELDEGRRVRLPVLGEALEVLEDRVDPRRRKNRDGVFGVLVEVRVEDALVHEVGVLADVEEHPTQIVQLEGGE